VIEPNHPAGEDHGRGADFSVRISFANLGRSLPWPTFNVAAEVARALRYLTQGSFSGLLSQVPVLCRQGSASPGNHWTLWAVS
jgi:hypothetical protein